MTPNQKTQGLGRRDFLKTVAGATAAAAPVAAGGRRGGSGAPAAENPKPNRMIGIQVGAVSFVDEGVGPVLDIFQERGAVDTLYLTTFTYGRGLAGRQIPGQPFPDHGVQESDERIFHGGNYATPHPAFYRDTILKETRAPDHGDLDIVADGPARGEEARDEGLLLAARTCGGLRVPGFNEVGGGGLKGRRAGHALPV